MRLNEMVKTITLTKNDEGTYYVAEFFPDGSDMRGQPEPSLKSSIKTMKQWLEE